MSKVIGLRGGGDRPFSIYKKMEAIIPIEIYEVANGYHIKVDIMINSQKASVILDTGASVSVFDENRIGKLVSRSIKSKGAKAAGAGGAGLEQKEIMIENIMLGFINMKDYNAAVMDLSHVNETYKSLKIEQIDGILGGDILRFYDAVIDYSKKELVLRNF